MTTKRVWIPKYGVWGTVLSTDRTHATVQVDGYAATNVLPLADLHDNAPAAEPKRPYAGGFHGRRTR